MNTQANCNRVFDSELENCLLLIKALAEDMKFLMYSTRGYNTEHRETSSSRAAAVVEDAVSFVRFPLPPDAFVGASVGSSTCLRFGCNRKAQRYR